MRPNPASVWESLPAERDLAVARGECLGMAVCDRQHLAVQDLDGGKILGELVEIGFRARAGESRESVIDREQKLALVEVCEERWKVVAAALDFDVIAFAGCRRRRRAIRSRARCGR